MIVIIQCAARKRGDAGHLVTDAGKPVDVVAHPQAAPADASRIYARPDDPSDHGVSWRQVLLDYNRRPDGNPLGLYGAYQLYEEKVYVRLAERFGLENVFILSAGWGLIRADFLTPYYNITFSPSAEDYMRRRKTDQYDDFRMLPADTKDDIVFFGGKDYLSLFCSLTEETRGTRIVFYNSASAPRLSGCRLRRFETTRRTKWHYECAMAFHAGLINIR